MRSLSWVLRASLELESSCGRGSLTLCCLWTWAKSLLLQPFYERGSRKLCVVAKAASSTSKWPEKMPCVCCNRLLHLFPLSASSFRSRWEKVLFALKVPKHLQLTPASIRGGGAIAAYRHGEPIQSILMWRMRLLSSGSLRSPSYLQELAAESFMVKWQHPGFVALYVFTPLPLVTRSLRSLYAKRVLRVTACSIGGVLRAFPSLNPPAVRSTRQVRSSTWKAVVIFL